MLAKSTTFFRKLYFPLLILLLVTVICWKNYIPGTWLSGWDTLHPEFNFGLYLKRIFYGVWQEHQGVGALATQSHPAEISRLFIVWLLSLFIPLSAIRYSFYFLTLYLGSLGMYFFLNTVLSERGNNKLAAFLGACYYLLNLTVVQQYFVPLEMFAVHFATLPWLFLLTLKYLNKGDLKNLISFFILSVFAGSLSHTATLFYVYFMAFSLFILGYVILARQKIILKRGIALVILTLAVNSYWLLPNLYYVFSGSSQMLLSKINRNFSDEAFLQSRSFGTLPELALGKNFLFNWRSFDFENNVFVDLLSVWKKHLLSTGAVFVGYLLFIMAICGILLSFIKRNKIGLILLPLTFVSIFFWINSNPPFTSIFEIFRQKLPLLAEAFRFPFTKFSIILIFCLAFYYASTIHFIAEKIQKKESLFLTKFFHFLIGLSFTSLLIWFSFPMFQGYLISPLMKVSLPAEYFLAFDYFKNQNSSLRIAKLPLNTYWGWNYYSWGYEGAGFTWFGLPQPTFDREFDRWSPYNESFYNEASSALYQKNLPAFEKVLAKYQVGYLLLDKSVINAGDKPDLLFIPETEELLSKSTHIWKSKTIGFLTVYQTDLTTTQNFIFAPSSYSFFNADTTYQEIDPFYQQQGDYLKAGDIFYPFSNLDKRGGVKITSDGQAIYFNFSFPTVKSVKEIIIPSAQSEKIIMEVNAIAPDNNTLILALKPVLPKIIINNNIYQQPENSELTEFKFKRPVSDFLQINNQLFSLSDISVGNQNKIGTMTVSAESEPQITFYAAADSRGDISEALQQDKPRFCADPDRTFILSLQDNIIDLNTNGEAICLGHNFKATDALYEFSFASKSTTATPQFCLTQGQTQTCLDSQLPEAYIGEENGWQKFRFRTALSAGPVWLDFATVSPQGKFAQVFYKDFQVAEYPKISTEKLIKPAFGGGGNLVYSVNEKIKTLTLALPKTFEIRENFYLDRGNKLAFNCDVKKEGNIFTQKLGKSVVYQAENGGVNCDYYDYPDLAYDSAYLLEVSGINTAGRGLKIYVFNKDNPRADLEQITPAGAYTENYIILPKNYSGNGYSVNTESRSFGRIAAQNTLSGLALTPIDYELLKNTILIIDNAKFKGENLASSVSVENNLMVTAVKKIGTYKYNIQFKIQNANSKNNLIVLSQGYDKGWIAISIPNYKLLEHVKVNSWENGWLVPAGTQQLTVVYWPQYLEFLGLAVFLITLGILIFPKQRLNS